MGLYQRTHRTIESRAFIVVFDPSPEELHFEVGRRGWFRDQEVYNFFWEHRRFITRPDMRAYRRIAEQKHAGRPWRKRALEMLIGDKRMQEIAKLPERSSLCVERPARRRFRRAGSWGPEHFFQAFVRVPLVSGCEPRRPTAEAPGS